MVELAMPLLHKITLDSEMAQFLREVVPAEDGILSRIPFNHVDSEGRLIIELDYHTIEALRTFLTEQLARVGFNKDYSLTEDGQTLEALIDTFYVAPLRIDGHGND